MRSYHIKYTTHTMMDAVIHDYTTYNELQEIVTKFAKEVWLHGLQAKMEPQGGICSCYGNDILLVMSTAGRTMLTFQSGDCSVTTISVEGETSRPTMGLNGMDCTINEGMIMITDVAIAYKKQKLTCTPKHLSIKLGE